MERQDPTWQRQRALEELLLRFLKAYEEGNLEVFGAILQQAQDDPELDALIWDVFPTYLREEEHISPAPAERFSSHLKPVLPPDWKQPEPLPLTLADVAARGLVELTLHREMYTDPHAVQIALNTLIWSHDPLPLQLDERSIELMCLQHGLAVPPAFYDFFLQAARLLQEKRSAKS